ncbi:MAG: DUF4097 family beta strand repeat protein [Opitutaceae bacterium]|nr:DUF4097 family beta strand repeat protein [Opitutaceae bacterium]
MKTLLCILTVGWLSAVPATAREAIVREIRKTFTVQPGGLLKVDMTGGDVRVMPSEGDEVRVLARQKVRARNEAAADELVKKLELTMSQTGNEVIATAKYPEQKGLTITGIWPPVEVDFEIVVPTRFNVDLRTSGGDIVVGNLIGDVAAKTAGGDVVAGHIVGAVEVRTSGGDISLASATGAAVLSTSGGDIHAGRIDGGAELLTSGGDITAEAVAGRLLARTSGGDIEVTVDRAAAFNLDASTSGGEVESSGLSLVVAKGGNGKSKLVGTINSGGPELKLRTSGGDIDIRAR